MQGSVEGSAEEFSGGGGWFVEGGGNIGGEEEIEDLEFGDVAEEAGSDV